MDRLAFYLTELSGHIGRDRRTIQKRSDCDAIDRKALCENDEKVPLLKPDGDCGLTKNGEFLNLFTAGK